MIINGVEIEDTFAEAFGMTATRLLITADSPAWAATAAASTAGREAPRIRMLPPPTALVVPTASSQTNSPSITGMRQ